MRIDLLAAMEQEGAPRARGGGGVGAQRATAFLLPSSIDAALPIPPPRRVNVAHYRSGTPQHFHRLFAFTHA